MPKTVVVVLLSLVVWGACMITPALAQNESLLAEYRARVQDQVVDLAKSRAVLESKDKADWTVVDIQSYLLDSIWEICDGLILYEYKNRHLPDELSDLSGTEYIPVWPGNAFSDWAPMEVLSVADGFKAGNLVLQVCPPEFYSVMNDPTPLSFELGIYGPDIKFASLNSAKPLAENTWATTPEGVYVMLGAYTETAAHMRKKWEAWQKKNKEEEDAK